MHTPRRSGWLVGGALLAAVAVLAGCSRPVQPMKVLMIVGGEYHDYVDLPRTLAERLTERGQIAVEVTDDLASLTADRIEPFGVLVFNTCHRPALSDEFKSAVLRYVEGGKGLVAVHCALWSYESWPQWAEMLGGYVEAHDKYGPYEVVVLDPAHPTMIGLGNRFEVTDEPYLVERRDPAATVLIETARPHRDPQGKERPGPEPQVWVKPYGKGRIFVTTFGHDEKTLGSEPIIDLLHNGIRWAGGLVGEASHNVLTVSEQQVGFELLFNGRDLAGWTGGRDVWTVENGELVGRADGLERDVFLMHEKEFGDFELHLSVQLVKGNSGVQIRSVRRPEDPQRELRGPQVEIVPGRWGALYDYGGTRGVLSDELDEQQEQRLVVPGAWNDLVIRAVGPEITVAVNGLTTARFSETGTSQPRRGLIGLQLHRAEPMEVRFRDVRIRALGG